MPEKYSNYSLQDIRESKLLTPERLAEVEAGVSARIFDPVLVCGGKIAGGKVVNLGDAGLSYFPLNHAGAEDFMVRHILPLVLTPGENDTISKRCFDARRAERERERFAAAKKIPVADYKGERLFSGLTDNYHTTDDDIDGEEIMIADDGTRYLWATDRQQVIRPMDVRDVTENDLQNYGWEDMDVHDLEGVPALQAALNAFVEANKGVVSFTPDYSTAVVFPPAT